MPDSPVNVNFNADPPACNPDPVVVNLGLQDGVEWTGNQANYTFTGLDIDGVPAPTPPFGTPVITSVGPLSRMRVDDDVNVPDDQEYVDYKYTLHYTDPNGTALTVDPRIRNRK